MATGFKVARSNFDDIVDARETRGIVESMTARLDFSRYVQLNAQSHRLLVQPSGSRTVQRAISMRAVHAVTGCGR